MENSLKRIRLAGVPEQAFIPIKLAQETGIFARLGIDVEWVSTPEGTGKLLTLVESGEVDVSLTVTDVFIAGKAKGREVSLCGTISSPLDGLFCETSSPYDTMEEMVSEETKTVLAVKWGW